VEKPTKILKIKNIESELSDVRSLLHKDELIWPYQKLDLRSFTKKFFPYQTEKEAQKYFRLKPEKFLSAIEIKLKTIATFIKPLDERLKALEFQKELFDFFSIYSPKKLKKCQKILKKTPRQIREEFFSENTLKLAKKKSNMGQKHISELMQLWLNMRYYGTMSMGLAPQFLIPFLKSSKTLDEKKQSIKNAIEQIKPEIEKKLKEYDEWVYTKQRLDEERKLMTFGPESIKSIINNLGHTYYLATTGEINKAEAEKITNLVKETLKDVRITQNKEKKNLISEENEKVINDLIEKINSKPKFFFVVAQITNALVKDKDLTPVQKRTLQNLIKVTNLLPENTEEALENQELIRVFGIIFEPLENLLHIEDITIGEKDKKSASHVEDLNLLNEALDRIANWILNRIIQEKKPGLERILKIFDGIPSILGAKIIKLIKSEKIKLDIEKFKECIIEHLSRNGIYEIYSGVSEDKKGKSAELEVADEIVIPPEADMRLAPINKQIKFEFMKFLETSEIEVEKRHKQPLFNVFESNRIVPYKIVETLLNTTQDLLVNIINANSQNKLHEIIKVDKSEYEVKLKTTTLKLKPLMQKFDDTLLKLMKKLIKYKLQENTLLSSFKDKIETIWINSLITKKKIIIEEKEISTSKVSAIAAKLMGPKPKTFQGPPSAKAPPKGPPSKLPAVPAKAPPKGPPSKLPAVPSKVPPRGPPSKLPAVPSKAPPKGPPSKLPTGPSKNPPSQLKPVPSKSPPSKLPTGPSKNPPSQLIPVLTKSPPSKSPAVPSNIVSPKTSTSQTSKSEPISKLPGTLPSKINKGHPSIISVSSSKLNKIAPKLSKGALAKGSESSSLKITKKTPSKISEGSLPNEIDALPKKIKGPPRKKIKPSSEITGKSKKLVEVVCKEASGGLGETMLNSLECLPHTKPVSEGKPGIYLSEKEKQRIDAIRNTISEVEHLLEDITQEIDKFSAKEIRNAFKLLSKVHKLNIENVSPKEVREVISLAEELKINRDIIQVQLKHLQALDIEKKLSEASLRALESKLELVLRYFNDNIEEITHFIEQLGEKTSFYLKEYYKKRKSYWTRVKINKACINLRENVQFLIKIGRLDDETIKKAYKLYQDLQQSRRRRRRFETGQIAQKFADVIGIDKKLALKYTRQRELKSAIEEIFEVRIKRKKLSRRKIKESTKSANNN